MKNQRDEPKRRNRGMRINFWLGADPQLNERVRQHAQANGTTASGWIRQVALREARRKKPSL